jgi:hypothetical protein
MRTGWRDILVEERPITSPFRHRRVHEDQPAERLVEQAGELVGIIGGERRRFRLHVRDDGARTWVPG